MASMAQAIRMALHFAETNLDLKDVFGQDVGAPLGGVFTATQGIKTSWNTPLDERGIISMATGIALTGERCVAEIQFADYIFNTIDLLKIAGNTAWVSNANFKRELLPNYRASRKGQAQRCEPIIRPWALPVRDGNAIVANDTVKLEGSRLILSTEIIVGGVGFERNSYARFQMRIAHKSLRRINVLDVKFGRKAATNESDHPS